MVGRRGGCCGWTEPSCSVPARGRRRPSGRSWPNPTRWYVVAERAGGELAGYAGLRLGGGGGRRADPRGAAVRAAGRRRHRRCCVRCWPRRPAAVPPPCCSRCAPTTTPRSALYAAARLRADRRPPRLLPARGGRRPGAAPAPQAVRIRVMWASRRPMTARRPANPSRYGRAVGDAPLVLGIETSCDETGVGIVRGRSAAGGRRWPVRWTSTPASAGWCPRWPPGRTSRR